VSGPIAFSVHFSAFQIVDLAFVPQTCSTPPADFIENASESEPPLYVGSFNLS
jgi:hypothetical protein